MPRPHGFFVCVFLTLTACGDDAGGETTNTTTTTSASTSTAGESSGGGSSSSGSVDTSSGSMDTSATTSATTGPGEPFSCGDATCNADQVCVTPCCGGAPPPCFELPPDMSCGDGELDKGGSYCCASDPDPACMMTQWCIPGPCTPDPPFCVPANTIRCEIGMFCFTEHCEGDFDGTGLECACG